MQGWQVALIVALGLWVLVESKTSRPDGRLLKTHPFRRLMFYIMPSRAESIVFIDADVRAEKLMQYLKEVRPHLEVDVSHLAVAAASIAIAENPRMNRFVSGRRLYQRFSRTITFSVKRKKLDRKAALSMIKMTMPDGESFRQFCARVNEQIGVERSGTKTAADKEYDLFNLLPRPVLLAAVPVLKLMDYWNLLPAFFIQGDGLYTGMFIANLGSISMPAGYHHLYEWGNCPFFLMVGRVEDRVVVEDGAPVVRRILPVRITFDERIDDGLAGSHGIAAFKRVLEDPARYLGCTAADGSDDRPMWPRPGVEREGVEVEAEDVV